MMPAVAAKRAAIDAYVSTANVPEASLLKMAKFGAVVDRWMTDSQLNAYGHPVLDGHGRLLRHRALHAHEHDEQRPDPQRV